jgi:NADH:ubiquinone oxidoreductase subunit 6 (subunit J)
LTTFILATVAWLGAVLLAPFAIFPGGDFVKSNDALVVVGLVLVLAGAVCVLVSIVCGLFAVKRRPVVLWWVIPSVLAVGFLGFLVVSIIVSLS